MIVRQNPVYPKERKKTHRSHIYGEPKKNVGEGSKERSTSDNLKGDEFDRMSEREDISVDLSSIKQENSKKNQKNQNKSLKELNSPFFGKLKKTE
jgi:hypothetical protein